MDAAIRSSSPRWELRAPQTISSAAISHCEGGTFRLAIDFRRDNHR
jgi:hypothetical protein